MDIAGVEEWSAYLMKKLMAALIETSDFCWTLLW